MFFTFFIPYVNINSGVNVNKSLSSFYVGIIFSIIGFISSYFLGAVILLLTIAIQPNSFISLIPYINLITYVLSFIGAIFSLFKAKISGIIMLTSSIFSLILFAILCFGLKMINFIFILFWLPTLFILIASIIAFKNSKNK